MKTIYEYSREKIADLIISDMAASGVELEAGMGAKFECEVDGKSLSVRVELIDAPDECGDPECPVCSDELKAEEKSDGKMTPKEFSEFMDELLMKALKKSSSKH